MQMHLACLQISTANGFLFISTTNALFLRIWDKKQFVNTEAAAVQTDFAVVIKNVHAHQLLIDIYECSHQT